MAALGNLEPNLMPRATDFIPQMISYIERLIKGGFAYPDEGHVLFSVSNYKNYGRLSGRSIEDMIAGARVEVASYKRNPMDFVLWKPSEQDLPGVYFLLGASVGNKYPHHNTRFDFDEKAMINGVKVFLSCTLDFLNN